MARCGSTLRGVMPISLLLLLFLFLLVEAALCQPSSSSSSSSAPVAPRALIEFEDGNYKQYMEKYEWIVVLMYTPWNRRSTDMLFQWNGLSALLAPSAAAGLELARVNCQAHKLVCQHFHEFQFPTIRLIRRSYQTVIYQSFWDINYVAKWLNRYLTALRRLDGSREQLLGFTRQNNWALAVFRDKTADYLEYSKLVFSLCQEYPEYQFAYMMYDDALMEGVFSAEPPWVRTRVERVLHEDSWKTNSTLLINTEKGLRMFSGSFGDVFSQAEMDNFFYSYVQPPIAPFVDRQTIARYLDYGLSDSQTPKPVLIYFAERDDPYSMVKLGILRAIAFSLVGRISVVHTDRSRTQALQARLSPNSLKDIQDLFVFIHPRRNMHYILPDQSAFRLEVVVPWALSALHHIIPSQSMISSRIPFKNDLVTRDEATWKLIHLTDKVSAACKRWSPFIQELGKLLHDSEPRVDLVSVDTRTTSLPWNMAGMLSRLHSISSTSVSVDGLVPELVAQLPLTFLVQDFSETHAPIFYFGPRNLESMLTFIKSKTTTGYVAE